MGRVAAKEMRNFAVGVWRKCYSDLAVSIAEQLYGGFFVLVLEDEF